MNNCISVSMVLMIAGCIGYYLSYLKGRRIFAEQMGLYQDGIPIQPRNETVQELYQIILSVHHPGIKNVWINENTTVVEGIKRKHEFYIENGMIKIKYPYSTKNLYKGIFRSLKQMKIHRDIAALVEGNQIMDAIAATQQVNILQKDRGYGKSSIGLKILCPSFAAIIIGGVLLCIGVSFQMNSEIIQYAKDKCPVNNVDATYEDIFNFYLREPEWDYFETEQNECIVEVSGISSVDDNIRLRVQFKFVGVSSQDSIASYTPISICYMEVNGETCDADDITSIVEYIVQKYTSD